jgi:magnesium chelatase family protein
MAKNRGFSEIFIPKENVQEAAFFEGLKLIPVSTLKELILHLEGKSEIAPTQISGLGTIFEVATDPSIDFSEIAGQQVAKRALEIAAAGGHNVLFQGPPGTGKTLLARSLPGILPGLTVEEAIEATKIYSVAGLLNEKISLIKTRPFRSPHHTASGIAVIGGGSSPRPGEVSLAHRGVLFLDEFPEFPRDVLENLRQPMEDGFVTVARVRGSVMFPAKFILIAAMNPCPCGWYGDPEHECQCSLASISKYRKKISGPIRDRIDLTVLVPRIPYETLKNPSPSENSTKVRSRVEAARSRQSERFSSESQAGKRKIFTNSEMGVREIKKFCQLDDPSDELLKTAERKYGLSPRAIHRIIKTGRTIADFEGSEKIKEEHLAEALQYRDNEQITNI